MARFFLSRCRLHNAIICGKFCGSLCKNCEKITFARCPRFLFYSRVWWFFLWCYTCESFRGLTPYSWFQRSWNGLSLVSVQNFGSNRLWTDDEVCSEQRAMIIFYLQNRRSALLCIRFEISHSFEFEFT